MTRFCPPQTWYRVRAKRKQISMGAQHRRDFHHGCSSAEVTAESSPTIRSTLIGLIAKCSITLQTKEVTLQLIKIKCLPVLLYGLEACPLTKSDLQSLDFDYLYSPEGIKHILKERGKYSNNKLTIIINK